MKRRWNLSLWAGFLLVLAGLVSYIPLFALFPITRDFPWANLLLFSAGGALLWVGLRRAFRQPGVYRGKIFGPILAAVSGLGVCFFAFGIFYAARQLPAAATAPRVGEKAPGFALPDQTGKTVTLTELLSSAPTAPAGAKANGALLIFFRGQW